MIDFHNHLIPGVDDGAADEGESRAALAAFREQGVTTVITTPHLRASLAGQAEECASYMRRVDAGWERLRALAAAEFPEMRLERGFEVMLDTPAPQLSDPRLRLAASSYVLVEFPFMSVPPNAAQAIFDLQMAGWHPVLAHPERYPQIDPALRGPEAWMRSGALLQVNCGSLLGKYGDEPRRIAWELLQRGWVRYLGSDYHARGSLHVAACRAELERVGAGEQARLLMEENPARLLRDEPPLDVPPVATPRAPLWRRILGGK